jgi:hypothetical protein
MAGSEIGRVAPHPRVFFVSAYSKGVAGESLVSADSTGLKVAVFSVSWKRLVSADFKEVTGSICILYSNRPGTAHSKGVRRTAWRGRMVRRARKNRADLQSHYSTLVPYVNDYLQVLWMLRDGGCLFPWPRGKREARPPSLERSNGCGTQARRLCHRPPERIQPVPEARFWNGVAGALAC